MKRMSFKAACQKYIHRFTMEHIPNWATQPGPEVGKYYAPQFKTDREWYENTRFPPEPICSGSDYCYTSGQTWPLGEWLDKPYRP